MPSRILGNYTRVYQLEAEVLWLERPRHERSKEQMAGRVQVCFPCA